MCIRDSVGSLRETFAKEEIGAGTAVAAVLTGTGLLALYELSLIHISEPTRPY